MFSRLLQKVQPANSDACAPAATTTRGDDEMPARLRVALLLGLVAGLANSALARDDGRFANSPLKPWFESLHSEFGPCCSDAEIGRAHV